MGTRLLAGIIIILCVVIIQLAIPIVTGKVPISKVQSGTIRLGDGVVQQTATISPVNTTRAVLQAAGPGLEWRVTLTNATTITAVRLNGKGQLDIWWGLREEK